MTKMPDSLVEVASPRRHLTTRAAALAAALISAVALLLLLWAN
jgi:hypothetical protein